MYSSYQLAKKYLQYYLHASNGKGHGIHSPFVFSFIKFVLNDKKSYAAYEQIESLRQRLLKDKRELVVQDFGAGSSRMRSATRRVDRIAASSLKPKKYAQLLYRIAACYKPATIVELGTSLGTSTAYLASGNPSANVYTLEGAAAIADVAKENFAALSLGNIELTEGDFARTLPALLSRIARPGLVFVDGNHREAPTLAYFETLLERSHEDTIIIFDDIHWSAEMESAWAAIRSNAAITLSIDLFFIGIVWLRKDFKAKQHFSIRF